MTRNDLNELLRLDRTLGSLVCLNLPLLPGTVTFLQTLCSRIVELLPAWSDTHKTGSFYALDGAMLLHEANHLQVFVNTALAEMAEQLRAERQQDAADYTGRPMPIETGPCPDADKVRDGWGGWIDPATGQSCPPPAASTVGHRPRC
jgi:hypothetical protein